MSKSLKEEIILWSQAIAHYDKDELKESLLILKKLKKSSRLYFNIGIIYRVRGQNQDAIKAFTKATLLDPWFAAAYFFKAVSYCESDRFNEAVTELNESLQRLRGNAMIDYSQLGLNLVLESADVLLNRGICYYMLKKSNYAKDDLKAAQEVAPNDHCSIGLKLEDLASVPFALAEIVEIFCPPSNKITKDEKVDYLGKSKIIAAVDESDTFTGFLGRVQRSNSSPEIRNPNNTKGSINTKSFDRGQPNLPGSPLSPMAPSPSKPHHIITTDMPSPIPAPVTPSTPIPNSKGRIKIKFVYQGKAKVLMAPDDVTFDDLLRKLRKKCNADIDLFYGGKTADLDQITNDNELDIAIEAGEPVLLYCE